MPPSPPLSRPLGERFAAWIVTGPVGLVGALLSDIGAYWLERLRRR
jgi:hypothetical protein